MTATNLPKLSARAQKALDLLANGGVMSYRLERNHFTGRDQFQTRFCATTSWDSAAKGLGTKTKFELQDAGFRFKVAYSSSVSTHYVLDHGA